MKKSKVSRLTKKETPVRTAKTKRKSSQEDFSISTDIKKQLLGFLILLFGVLIFLALISYSDKDQATLEKLSLIDVFRREAYSAVNVTFNWLGIAGAYVSNFFINSFFGYFSVIIAVVLILFGLTLLRKKPLGKTIQFSIYSLLLMLCLASSFGLIRIFTERDFVSPVLSGTSGDFFASVFYQTLGSAGASIFFGLFLILFTLLLIDGNIIKTFARMKLFSEKLMESFHKEKSDLNIAKEKNIKDLQASGNNDLSESNIDELEEALKKERERILKSKYSRQITEDASEIDRIKETMINRPKQEETAKIIIQEKKNKDAKPELVSNSLSKEDANEIDINPQNSNEVDKLESNREEDFVEEKLEKYIYPDADLLIEPTKEEFEAIPNEELTENGRLLQAKLLKFGIEVEKVFATPGPVVTLYELVPAADVKLSKIESLQDDIALAMKAKGIRMIIPIPGKGTVGVEIPNRKAQLVRIKSLLSSQKFDDSRKSLPIAFGKTIDGEVFIDDLAKMPHLLIAGATGSGKSVGINTIIGSLLYKMHPSDLKFVMIDPKKIELSLYSKLKKHFLATSSDINESIVTSPSNAVSVLKSVECEMENRYDKLANAGVRNIESYNEKYALGKLKDNDAIRHKKMPFIVVIIDELADLMITAKREIEEPIARIAQMARAVGIHLIVATQRPSVDVITGVIKANFPVRIAYQVASKIDSRTILDMGGADQLLRNGDMLYLSAASSKPIRIQNALITTEECEKVAEFIEAQQGFTKPYLLPSLIEKKAYSYGDIDDRDELFGEAAKLIFKLQQCSTSTLQRRLKLGYARAARIVDQLEVAGIVGPKNGSNAREVLVMDEDELINIL
ncbi:MAG TPA: DNA translocase FtsK [Ignavibacteria bacterium]|nr:DNA translocase FtsK [Ignavibacteria bacterium]HMR41274.1 DNA translocase FtsK [Ignavibacteria bacterium]